MSNRGDLNLADELVTSHSDANTLVQSTIEEIYNKGNLNLAHEIVTSYYVLHDSALNMAAGSTGLKDHATALRTAFPDLHLNIEEMHSEGDTITTRLTAQGTHNGKFLNVPATGRSIETTGILISRVKNDKLTESFMNWDTLSVLQQIGAVQNLGLAKARGAN
jgi:steroid delta-isomerase-like uncharacterized protein